MGTVKHLILTRFNVASPGKEQAIRLKPHWLEKRFQLFADMCLPSVKSQTLQDFEWHIFFDTATPPEYKTRIAELQKIYPFHAEFTDSFEMNRLCPQLLKSGFNAEWLLTTRLDSDDILAVDFVENLRQTVKTESRGIINFPHGIILSITGEKPALYLHQDKSNPFTSLIEPYDEKITTIWGVNHTQLESIAPVTQVETHPLWLQVVHGDNVLNRVRGGNRVPVASYGASFPYLREIGTMQEKELDILLENRLIVPLRALKESGIVAAKKILGRK